MKVNACMKQRVISIPLHATVQQAMEMVVRHHIGTLPVVDDELKLVGLVRLRNLLALGMPDFVNLLESISFVHSFGAVEYSVPGPKELARPVKEIMTEPISCQVDCSLLHAAALLHRNAMQDLPVVDAQGHLVGIASHVDIGTFLIQNWGISSDPAHS
jgi:CBS-domain-containing membrane protein